MTSRWDDDYSRFHKLNRASRPSRSFIASAAIDNTGVENVAIMAQICALREREKKKKQRIEGSRKGL